MAKSIANRMKKIEGKISPNKYCGLEDILWLIHNKKRQDLTVAEKRRVEELKSLPVEPGLKRALQEIREKGVNKSI